MDRRRQADKTSAGWLPALRVAVFVITVLEIWWAAEAWFRCPCRLGLVFVTVCSKLELARALLPASLLAPIVLGLALWREPRRRAIWVCAICCIAALMATQLGLSGTCLPPMRFEPSQTLEGCSGGSCIR